MALSDQPWTITSVHDLAHARQNVSPRRLVEPGPTPAQLRTILGAAAAAPDHGQLQPWRFVLVPPQARAQLADVFAQALRERDAAPSEEAVAQARDKAWRAPLLLLAVARLNTQPPQAGGVSDAERLVSLGCAIQNMLLCAHAAGFGTGLTSGQALASLPLRHLFQLQAHEQAVCWIAMGTVAQRKNARERPAVERFFSSL